MLDNQYISLVCEITKELSELHSSKDSKDNEIYNCRVKLFNDIIERMRVHSENMKHLSREHELLYNARKLELSNKEREKTDKVRLGKVMNYISHRIDSSKILNKQLKAKYDKHMNDLTENFRSVYADINKLNDYDYIISRAHASAVQHTVRQAIQQDTMHREAYNKKQYEIKCILDELEYICKLEQSQILQIKEFEHQQAVFKQQAAYNQQQEQAVYNQQHEQPAYNQQHEQPAYNQQQEQAAYTFTDQHQYQYQTAYNLQQEQPAYTFTYTFTDQHQHQHQHQHQYQPAYTFTDQHDKLKQDKNLKRMRELEKELELEVEQEIEQKLKEKLEQELKLKEKLEQEQKLKEKLEQEQKLKEKLEQELKSEQYQANKEILLYTVD